MCLIIYNSLIGLFYPIKWWKNWIFFSKYNLAADMLIPKKNVDFFLYLSLIILIIFNKCIYNSYIII